MRSFLVRRRRPSPTFVLALLGVFLAAGGANAWAAATNFLLNTANTSTAQTSLNGSAVAGKAALRLTNTNTAAGSTALALGVAAGHQPFTTSSSTKVANLNADRLDGIDSAGFYQTGQKVASATQADSALDAANAGALDGLDSTQFVRGAGRLVHGALAQPPNGTGWLAILSTSNPAYTIGYNCPSSLSAQGVVVVRNDSPETVNVFLDNGGADPPYQQLAPSGGRWDIAASAGGEHYSISIQGSTVSTFELYTVHRASDCHAQVEGWISG